MMYKKIYKSIYKKRFAVRQVMAKPLFLLEILGKQSGRKRAKGRFFNVFGTKRRKLI